MKSIKLVGLCLAAVFAFAALAASAAQAAEPEWGRCVAQKHGNYTEGNCFTVATKKGVPDHKGKYEWLPGAEARCLPAKHGNFTESSCLTVATKKGVPDHKGKFETTGGSKFTAAAGAGVLKASIYECVNSHEESVQVARTNKECEHYENNIAEIGVECEKESATGEAAGADEVANVSVHFKGCTLFGVPANSPGHPAGEIQVNPLKGRLGYIEKATHDVGVLLEPATVGGTFAEFELEGVPLRTVVGVGNATQGAFYEPEATGGFDGVISPITPVNTMTHTFTQEYKANYSTYECKAANCYEPTGTQVQNVPSKFEGQHAELLETYLENSESHEKEAWSPAGQELTNTNTLEGEAEIKG
jgi:hypothetical protein